MQKLKQVLLAVSFVVMVFATPANAQSSLLRQSQVQKQASARLMPTRVETTALRESPQISIANARKGAIIGGVTGLVLSALAVFMIERSSSGTNGITTRDLLPVLLATGLGAIVGAAVGAGWD